MTRPRPIPADLRGVAFRGAEARALGVSPRTRAAGVTRPFHGVRAVELADSVIDRCRAFEPTMLTGQFFSHTTALALFGIPVPQEASIHVSVAFPRTPPRGKGVTGHSVRRQGWTLVEGLPVARPELAWRQSASILELVPLVIAADALLAGGRDAAGALRPGRCSPSRLRAEVELGLGSRGARLASMALELARVGVASPAETRLRLAILGAGLPEPVVDLGVDIGSGRLWHPDLAYETERIAIEYEGDRHRTDRARWRRDIARREAFEDAGWRVIRTTADDLADPRDLASRLRRALASRADSHIAGVDRAVWHDSRRRGPD